MKFFRLLIAFTCYLVVLVSTTEAQLSNFSVPAQFNDLHTVYTYQKSNWDGTHSSTIFFYIKDSSQLESFKWSEGDDWATLVTAWFDWNTFSEKKFQNHRIFIGGERKLIAELEVKEQKKIIFTVMGYSDSMNLASEHWHSYDFDFAGLGFSWRALKDKQASFSFFIADAGMKNDKPAFENKGEVHVDYLGRETMNGKECLKYKIDGAGLQNKGGQIWINPENFMIELYKIELPDEEGFKNGQLKLLKTEKLSPAGWDKFINEKMAKK